MHIGKRLQIIRNSFGLSRGNMAKNIVSYPHYCQYETGKYTPPDDILTAIANKLNVPADYLLNYQKLDSNLKQLLASLKTSIDKSELTEAERIINEIKAKYPYISSIYQESLFYLLQSSNFYKSGKKNEAFSMLANELLLIEVAKLEELPLEFQETYYYMQALDHYLKKDYEMSYNYYLKQLPLINNGISKAITNNNIALALYKIKKISKAIPFAEEALNLHLREQQWEKAAGTHNLLGMLYSEDNNSEAAMRNYQMALGLVGTFILHHLEDKILNNIGVEYKEAGDLANSIEYFNKSLEKKIEYGLDTLVTYRSIIEIYLEIDLEKASETITEARKKINKEIDIYHLKVLEAKYNIKNNNLELYEQLMEESIGYFLKNKMWNYVLPSSEEFAKYYKDLKKYKQTSYYYELVIDAYKNIKGE